MKLKCETNTISMGQKILAEAKRVLRRGQRRKLTVCFEHGQWWVEELLFGAQWSVHDTDTGFSFEQVTHGEE